MWLLLSLCAHCSSAAFPTALGGVSRGSPLLNVPHDTEHPSEAAPSSGQRSAARGCTCIAQPHPCWPGDALHPRLCRTGHQHTQPPCPHEDTSHMLQSPWSSGGFWGTL